MFNKISKIVFLSFTILSLNSYTSLADTYDIDPSHSLVGFRIKHLSISNVSGQFSKVSGTIEFDENELAKSSTEATIESSSIGTLNEKRDEHLRSPDFFDVAKFPELKFKSKRIEKVSGNEFVIVGDLSMHGITREISLDTVFTGAATDPWGNERIGFSAKSSLNRKDYGLVWNKLLETGGLVVGENVQIQLDIEGIKRKEGSE